MRYSRQNKILEIINTYDVDTQEMLVELLEKSGFSVTQATVSRDIKDLQLIKVATSNGHYKYSANVTDDVPISDRFKKIFRESIKSSISVNNLIVVKTLSGCGHAAGEAVDSIGLPHLVGSVAGDNTLLLIVDDEKNTKEILEILDDLIAKRHLTL